MDRMSAVRRIFKGDKRIYLEIIDASQPRPQSSASIVRAW